MTESIAETTTAVGLKLAMLGDFDDDPSADTLLEFGDKYNFNMKMLDQTVNQARNAFENMEQVERAGVLKGVLYGGKLGVYDIALPSA
jgi:hypothetical protein